MDAFERELAITVLDGLFIGMLILWANFLIYRTLEKYKLREASKNSLHKYRIDKLITLWEMMGKLEANFSIITSCFLEISSLKNDNNTKSEYLKKAIKVDQNTRKLSDNFVNYLKSNLFIINTNEYQRLHDYLFEFGKIYNEFTSKVIIQMKEFKKRIEEKKGNNESWSFGDLIEYVNNVALPTNKDIIILQSKRPNINEFINKIE